MSALPWAWGARAAEVAQHYPADDLVDGRPMRRAVSVAASAPVLWRWLCQVAVAPYSYDWIDNLGRRSPRTLTPGADRLEVGQAMAVVFRLTSWDEGHHWTAVTGERGRRLLGTTSVTYAAGARWTRRDRPVAARLPDGDVAATTRRRRARLG